MFSKTHIAESEKLVAFVKMNPQKVWTVNCDFEFE